MSRITLSTIAAPKPQGVSRQMVFHNALFTVAQPSFKATVGQTCTDHKANLLLMRRSVAQPSFVCTMGQALPVKRTATIPQATSPAVVKPPELVQTWS